MALEAEELSGGTLRSALRGEISTWPGFADGVWWVQDASAAVPARLLAVQPGESALDLCAAPGGKTLQLAAAGASVVAVDRSAPRLVRVAENLARMGLTAETATDDAGSWPISAPSTPCCWTRPAAPRAPIVATPMCWAAKPGDVAALAGVQSRLLDSAAKRVKPGGRLVYRAAPGAGGGRGPDPRLPGPATRNSPWRP